MEFWKSTCLCVFPAAVVPPSGVKPPAPYSYQPGQLFSVQPKVEVSPSSSSVTTSQTWKIMESLNLGPQPKATPVASFTLSQAPSSSVAAPSSTTASNTNPDFPTVNLSDLHEFFPNISSAMAQEPMPVQGNTASSQASSSFNHQGPPFRVDDDDIPEFPSFPEAQAQGNLYSLNMEDIEDLLGSSMLGQAPCQQAVAAPGSAAAAPSNTAAQNTSDPASNPGSTWMNYPNSIVNLLQHEGMMNTASSSSGGSNNHQQGHMLDEFDELMSADEDRLISIFNSENQAGFVSGHQT